MPWQYPDNVPSSMKYLKPSIQKKAIAISNKILEQTNDEGKSIAIGIAKAKKVYDKKGLVKLASTIWQNHVARKRLKTILKAIKEENPDKLKELVIPKIILDEFKDRK